MNIFSAHEVGADVAAAGAFDRDCRKVLLDHKWSGWRAGLVTPISHVGGDTSAAGPEDYSGSCIAHFKFLDPSLGHISSSLILCNTDPGEQMMKQLHDDDQLVSQPEESEPL